MKGYDSAKSKIKQGLIKRGLEKLRLPAEDDT